MRMKDNRHTLATRLTASEAVELAEWCYIHAKQYEPTYNNPQSDEVLFYEYTALSDKLNRIAEETTSCAM